MSISCLCITYSRTALLEESIECFLRQDYKGDKELLILNDCEDQILSYDHPEVTIINLPTRFRSLGEKRATSVALAKYDNLAIWDDDDIYLPHRLSYSLNRMNRFKLGFFNLNQAFEWSPTKKIHGIHASYYFGGAMFTRETYNKARGFSHVNIGEDVEFIGRMDQACKEAGLNKRVENLSNYGALPESIYYIYRWQGVDGHISANVDNNLALEKVTQSRKLEINRPNGKINLNPNWKLPYDQLSTNYLKNYTKDQKFICIDDELLIFLHEKERLKSMELINDPWIYDGQTIVFDLPLMGYQVAFDVTFTEASNWKLEILERTDKLKALIFEDSFDFSAFKRYTLLETPCDAENAHKLVIKTIDKFISELRKVCTSLDDNQKT